MKETIIILIIFTLGVYTGLLFAKWGATFNAAVSPFVALYNWFKSVMKNNKQENKQEQE